MQTHWKYIVPLLLVGALFAAATISGAIHGHERWVAPLLLVSCGIWLGRRLPDQPIVNGFIAGFLVAEAAILLQALFLQTYFTNNPGYRDIPIPFGLDARLATLVLSPINGLIAGLVVGLVTWASYRLGGKSD